MQTILRHTEISFFIFLEEQFENLIIYLFIVSTVSYYLVNLKSKNNFNWQSEGRSRINPFDVIDISMLFINWNN